MGISETGFTRRNFLAGAAAGLAGIAGANMLAGCGSPKAESTKADAENERPQKPPTKHARPTS